MCHPGVPGNPHSVSERPPGLHGRGPQKPSPRGRGSSPTRGKTTGDGELREGRGRVTAGLLLRHPALGLWATTTVNVVTSEGGPAPNSSLRSETVGMQGSEVLQSHPTGHRGEDTVPGREVMTHCG